MPWEESGRDGSTAPKRLVLTDKLVEELSSGKIVVSDVAPTIPGVDSSNFYSFVLDCVWAVVHGDLTLDKFAVAMQAAGSMPNLSEILTNVFWVVWTDIEGPKRNAFAAEAKAADNSEGLAEDIAITFVDLVKKCRQLRLVSDQDLLEGLDLRLLVQSCVTQKPHAKEESEGFSKLITLLNNSALRTHSDARQVSEQVNEIIGFFALQPLKVTYCIINALESNPSSAQVLLQLDPMLNSHWCSAAVAIRLRHTERFEDLTSFFDVIVMLIEAGRIQLAHVLVHMQADVSKLADAFASAHDAEFIKSVQDAVDVRSVTPSAADFKLDISAFDAAIRKQVGMLQPIQLLAAVLRHGAWSTARLLLKAMSQQAKCDVVEHEAVGLGLLERLHGLLEPAHAKLFPDGPFGKCLLALRGTARAAGLPQAQPLGEECLQVLKVTGPYLFRRPDVMNMLLRLLDHILSTHSADSAAAASAELVLKEAVFPALCMLAANPVMSMLAWRCIGRMSHEKRHAIYYHASMLFGMQPLDTAVRKGRVTIDTPLLLRLHCKRIDDDVGRIFRRMTLPSDPTARREALETTTRMLSKLATSHPLVVAQRVRTQACNYSNQHEMLVECVGGMPTLQLDIILFEALRYFVCTENPRIGPDNFSMAEWLHNLSPFVASLLTRYPHLDVGAICSYLHLRIRSESHPADVTLLADVLKTAVGALSTGVPIVQELNELQIASLPAGPIVRTVQLMLPPQSSDPEVLQKRALWLFEAMQSSPDPQSHVTVPLLICLCQQRPLLTRKLSSDKVKLVCELYDLTHTTLLRYIQFLHRLPLDRLRPVLPPLADLQGKFRMDTETVMTLYRPLLRKALEGWEPGQPAEPADSAPDGDDTLSLGTLVRCVCDCLPQLRVLDPKEPNKAGHVDPRFFLLFWSLELQDIGKTEAVYKETEEHLSHSLSQTKSRVLQLRKDFNHQQQQSNQRHGHSFGPDKAVVSMSDIIQAEEEISSMQSCLQRLPDEKRELTSREQRMREYIEARKDYFFGPSDEGMDIPRAKMILHFLFQVLIDVKTTNFLLPFMFDIVFKESVALMRSCTDREAENFTIFISQMARKIDFRADLADTVGMRCSYKKPDPTDKGHAQTPEFADAGTWSKLCGKWQKALMGSIAGMIQDVKRSGEICVRNALKMVRVIIPVMLTNLDPYKVIEGALQKLLDSDVLRDDIKQLTLAAQRQLVLIKPSIKGMPSEDDDDSPAHRGNSRAELEEGEMPDDNLRGRMGRRDDRHGEKRRGPSPDGQPSARRMRMDTAMGGRDYRGHHNERGAMPNAPRYGPGGVRADGMNRGYRRG